MAKHDVTKTPFSLKKKISTDIYEILATDVKLTLGKVPKVLRRYLLPFLSYQENPAGGGAESASPGVCVLKNDRFLLFLVSKRSFIAQMAGLYTFSHFSLA